MNVTQKPILSREDRMITPEERAGWRFDAEQIIKITPSHKNIYAFAARILQLLDALEAADTRSEQAEAKINDWKSRAADAEYRLDEADFATGSHRERAKEEIQLRQQMEEQRDALIRLIRYDAQNNFENDLNMTPAQVLLYAIRKDAPWNAVCRVCGCSWFDPCPEGCRWVEPDLCSACVGKEQKTETEEKT